MGARGPKARTIPEILLAKVKIGDGCWEWTGALYSNGYGALNATTAVDRYESFLAHREMFAWWHGRRPKNLVLHHCDNRKCCRPSHLYDGTYSQNMRDTLRRSRHPRIKLSVEAAAEIKSLKQSGTPVMEIAKRFNIDRGQVWRVYTGKSWAFK